VTDLRDGRWHHVAVVFVGAGQGEVNAEHATLTSTADVATHVRLYIDGKLEPLSGGKSAPVVSLTSSSSKEVSTFSMGGSGTFEGWLDEFYLFENAVSPATILEIYEHGTESDGNRVDGQGIR
ncbi:MAG: LamG domain-containing protein, partial [Verrucomicrobia bacterium]|nr:LamG domain-containing protein [Verrucomicrobiota bacterium]